MARCVLTSSSPNLNVCVPCDMRGYSGDGSPYEMGASIFKRRRCYIAAYSTGFSMALNCQITGLIASGSIHYCVRMVTISAFGYSTVCHPLRPKGLRVHDER